jgi:hypothetical protein
VVYGKRNYNHQNKSDWVECMLLLMTRRWYSRSDPSLVLSCQLVREQKLTPITFYVKSKKNSQLSAHTAHGSEGVKDGKAGYSLLSTLKPKRNRCFHGRVASCRSGMSNWECGLFKKIKDK